MNLALIVGIYLLSLACPSPPPALISPKPAASQDIAPSSQPQAPQSQSAEPAKPSPSGADQTKSPAQVKTSTHRRHHKKQSNCSNSPTALNPTAGAAANSANPQIPGSTNQLSTDAGSQNANPAPLPPCPPPKKVVRNGGSNEPTVQLKGGTQQAWQQRSTEELTAETTQNLKKITGRQLTPSQQEMVSQIKEFMEQSKAAVAAGDLERGRNLAAKAHMLSDELIKP
jgi:hypothetical protein